MLVATGVTIASPASVRAAWSGSIGSAPRIQQIRGLACEATALQIALAAKGIDVSQDWISNQIGADLRAPVMGPDGFPALWGNPYDTFVGNVNLAMGRGGYGVYQDPVTRAARAAGATAWGGDHWNPGDLYEQIAAGNPVVVWVPWSLEPAVVHTMRTWDGQTVWFSRQEHAQTLIAFDHGAATITLSDPLTASIRTYPMGLFEQRFAQFHGQAVVVARQPVLPPPAPAPAATVAVRGSDDGMWSHSATGGWSPRGGRLIASPAVVLQPDGKPLYLAVGTDHQLWVRSDDLSWSLLAPGDQAYCVESPAAAVSGAMLIAGCQGGDGALYAARAALVPGALPVAAGFTPLGQTMWGGPAIAFVDGVATYVVDGADRHVMVRTDATGWNAAPYWCIGHPALAVNARRVLFACQGTDEQAWYSTATDTFPSNPVPLGGRLIDGVGAAPSGTGFDVAVTGVDLETFFTHVEASGDTGWHPLGGRVIGGASAG